MRADLEAEIAKLEADLAAAREKLSVMVNEIPSEFHTLKRELFDKIKRFFE